MGSTADPPTHHHPGSHGVLPPGRVQFSERAKQRLKIAAGFLRKSGRRFESGDFYQQVLDALESLQAPEKQALKGFVDWVEEYNMYEAVDVVKGKTASFPLLINQST